MRRRTFLTLGNEGISASKAKACDICLYSKSTQKLLIVEGDRFSASGYPSSDYTPVGVVVIPGSHNVYGDGSCAVMSLNEMSCDTPDTGSTSYQHIKWGQLGADISNMTNYNVVCYVGQGGSVNETVQGTTSTAFLPRDMSDRLQNPYDTDTYYWYNDGGGYYIPSPYNEDDSRNPEYYRTSSPSSSGNAMSDFDGIGNTTKLIKLATGQSKWKTASSITDNGGEGYSPAACCCWRYHTDGTNQGDWYLPAMGELGYIVPKLYKIEKTISNLKNVYNTSVNLQIAPNYWSSSEVDYTTVYNLLPDVGWVEKNSKGTYGISVIAFLRVK